MAPLRALGVRARRRPVTTLQNVTSAQSGPLHDKMRLRATPAAIGTETSLYVLSMRI